MVLAITKYGHPALRAKGSPITIVDARIRKLAQDMIETMEAAEGVGLAAQQVGLPLQMFVLDVKGTESRPSTLWVSGRRADPASIMPLVVINPRLETFGRKESGMEGCLSFPGVQAEITRPGRVRLQAWGLEGEEIDFEADGLLARAIQHEYDHLQGVLFIDRMAPRDLRKVMPEVEAILADTRAAGTAGPIVP